MKINAAAELAEVLTRLGDQKIVFAESCTCGMAAAMLGEIPGISNYFCGSQVVYRDNSKIDWLDVDADYLASVTSTSAEASQKLAIGVLAATPEATWSAAITGHLGPGMPENGKDGVVYLCIAVRVTVEEESTETECFVRASEEFTLANSGRKSRQIEAAEFMLSNMEKYLSKFA